jgi:hypothetical protein
MCKQYVNNREKFADLVYSLGSFEQSEIIREFETQQNGDIIIDGSQSIPEYLEELRESGALKYSNGKYYVTKYVAPTAAETNDPESSVASLHELSEA